MCQSLIFVKKFEFWTCTRGLILDIRKQFLNDVSPVLPVETSQTEPLVLACLAAAPACPLLPLACSDSSGDPRPAAWQPAAP